MPNCEPHSSPKASLPAIPACVSGRNLANPAPVKTFSSNAKRTSLKPAGSKRVFCLLSIYSKHAKQTNMSDASPVKVAIIGASGYSGEELVHRLLHHPQAELTAVTSRQYVGQTSRIFPLCRTRRGRHTPVTEPDSVALAALPKLCFALPHGSPPSTRRTYECWHQGDRSSADFRLNDPAVYEEFYETHPAPERSPRRCTVCPSYWDTLGRAAQPRPAVIPPAFSRLVRAAESRISDQIHRHHCQQPQRRERCRSQAGCAVPIRRMQ